MLIDVTRDFARQSTALERVDAALLTHAHRDAARFPTFAWQLRSGAATVVYASHVARLTPGLARFARGVSLLVLDGATWRRTLFSQLRVDEALPAVGLELRVVSRWR